MLSSCVIYIVPDFDQALLNGLEGDNEETPVLFAKLGVALQPRGSLNFLINMPG